ncbi:hypothetical protein [Nitrosomonas marina]|uniref:hypothetical protein n=1 Tax=Nitrosomonas marina TaxID=917 RepID=UPI0015A5A003|nr:hypothetical protein [Nitrosomonas marina]
MTRALGHHNPDIRNPVEFGLYRYLMGEPRSYNRHDCAIVMEEDGSMIDRVAETRCNE